MKSRFAWVSAAAFCAAVFSAVPSRAPAFALEGAKWKQPAIPNGGMHLQFPAQPNLLSDGSLSYYQSFENAMALWNEQLRDFQFTFTEEPNGAPKADGDGISQVSMQTTIYGQAFGAGVLAVTFIYHRDAADSGAFTENDMVFNGNRTWDASRSFGIEFHRVALHELGHVLGLNHPDEANPKQTVDAIMNSNVSGTAFLQADDIQGGQSLYGARANAPAESFGHGRLANISTRAQVGTAAHAMIGGFIVVDATKPVLIRAIGPSLPVSGALADPVLELHDGSGAIISTNNNWKDDPAQSQQISATGAAPTDNREAAIYATLAPGNYTAVVTGSNGSTGVALVEVYDLAQTSGKLANISTRGQVGTDDDVLIGGVILGGPQAVRVIVRAIGPSLSGSIPDALGDPTLELRNANGELLKSNDNWQTGDTDSAIANSGIAPKHPNESALSAYLAPGNFTAIVRGKNNSTGVGLVEAYDVTPPAQ